MTRAPTFPDVVPANDSFGFKDTAKESTTERRLAAANMSHTSSFTFVLSFAYARPRATTGADIRHKNTPDAIRKNIRLTELIPNRCPG